VIKKHSEMEERRSVRKNRVVVTLHRIFRFALRGTDVLALAFNEVVQGCSGADVKGVGSGRIW
jgi:hypothetical protein